MRLEALANKRVGILGYGREGVAALALLRHRFPQQSFVVFNETAVDVAATSASVEFRIGDFDGVELSDFDILIKSPGISPYRTAVETARNAGVKITSGSAFWFAEPRDVPVIAVTGSKGKSTTSSLIRFFLDAAGHTAVLAGNIGVPLLELFDPLGQPDFYVVELSSYQTADFDGRPDVAVLTNLFPEHLDWHGQVERYYADKLKLFAHQPPVCLVNAADQTSLSHTRQLQPRLYNAVDGWHISAGHICCGDRTIAETPNWSLVGSHNISNLVCALAAVDALGVDVRPGIERLAEFRGLPHRLEVLGKVESITVVDDSISTAPEATVAAIRTFAERPMTVIVGGHDRGLAWQGFVDTLKDVSVGLVIARGQNGPSIAALLREQLPEQAVCELATMTEAVKIGLAMTEPGGVLLLSPGAPSYGEYVNFEARGDAFAAAAGLSPQR